MIELDLLDLGLALALVGIAIALSRWQHLRLEGQLLITSLRATLQLLFLGYTIALIFALDNFWAVLAIAAVMLVVAAIVTKNRISQRLKGILPSILVSLGASTAITLSYLIFLIVQPTRWFDPQYFIPLAGILLGNATNGASLAGERLASALSTQRLTLETHLCLGATPQQAIAPYRQEAIRVGLIPTLNQLAISGLVTIPGIFAGQILAGDDPVNAAAYQLLILLAIVLTNLLAILLVTNSIYRQFFTANAQLRRI